MTDTGNAKPRLRSRLWFHNPHNPGMTALYLERYLNYGLTKEELTSDKPIIAIAQTGSDLSPCNRHHLELARPRARRHPRRRRHRLRVSGASDPGNRQAADGGARPKPRLSRARRAAVRLSDRRRRAHHRLRQDHSRLPDGGGDGEHSRDRALRRADAQRLAQRRARRLGHHRVEGARGAGRRPDRLRRVHRYRLGVGAVGRPLQHHGHGFDHECARRGARHVAAGMCRDPGTLPRARPDRLRDRPPRRRDRARGLEAVGHPDPQGLRERDRRLLGNRRLDQRADPHQCDRAACRRRAEHGRLGGDRLSRPPPRQHAAGGKISRRRVLPRRRFAGGDARARPRRPHPRRCAHHQRQDHRRERHRAPARGTAT